MVTLCSPEQRSRTAHWKRKENRRHAMRRINFKDSISKWRTMLRDPVCQLVIPYYWRVRAYREDILKGEGGGADRRRLKIQDWKIMDYAAGLGKNNRIGRNFRCHFSANFRVILLPRQCTNLFSRRLYACLIYAISWFIFFSIVNCIHH